MAPSACLLPSVPPIELLMPASSLTPAIAAGKMLAIQAVLLKII
jgi:hypothetical protein